MRLMCISQLVARQLVSGEVVSRFFRRNLDSFAWLRYDQVSALLGVSGVDALVLAEGGLYATSF